MGVDTGQFNSGGLITATQDLRTPPAGLLVDHHAFWTEAEGTADSHAASSERERQ